MKSFKSTIVVIDTEYITVRSKKLDILEIGAVALNDRFEPIDEFFIKCKPTRYSYSKLIGKLLQIDEKYFYSGVSYENGINNFFNWISEFKNPILCTWSDSEKIIFKERIQHLIRKTKHPYIKMFDIQRSYMDMNGLKDHPSLKKVLVENNIEINDKEMKLHNALNDSLYTAALFTKYSDFFMADLQSKDNIKIKHNVQNLFDNKLFIEELKKFNNCKSLNYYYFCSVIENKYGIGRATINAHRQDLIEKNIIEIYKYTSYKGTEEEAIRFIINNCEK